MPPRLRPWLPWLSLLIVYTVWGSTYLFIRLVVRELPPLGAASLRFCVAGLIAGALARWRDVPRHGWPAPRQVADNALIGVLLLCAGNGLVMLSQRHVPSGVAALLVAMTPLWMNLLAGRAGIPTWTWRLLLGTLCGLAGVLLVARPCGGQAAGWGLWPLGLVAASLAWAAGSIYAQTRPRRLPLLSAAAVQMLAGAAALLLLSLVRGEELRLLAHGSATAWLALAYLVAFGSLLGFTAYAYCLRTLPARIVGTYAYVNPAVAVALGSLVLDEPLSTGLLIGAGLIVAAVVLSTVQRRA